MVRTLANETLLDRMVRAVERVRERLLRATAALEAAGVDYAVAGGNALAAWVAAADSAKVHLQDMIGVGLIDTTWIPRLPVELATRLRHLFDTPEG